MEAQYISVNVSGAEDQFTSQPLKFTPIGARRWWNRLSRLQKSILLMTLCIFLGFTFLIALTWTAPPTAADVHHHQGLQHQKIIKNSHEVEDVIRRNHEEQASEEKRRDSWEWELPKRNSNDNANNVPTVPRALKPDVEPSIIVTRRNNKPKVNKQVAENIRSVISLDPVVPLESRKSVIDVNKPVDGKRMQFEGPQNPRQKAVVEAFLHCWNGYRKYAWGQDHLKPISGGGQDWFGLGLTLIDSLDTMYIMNLQTEFDEASVWVKNSLSYEVPSNVNLFETTIRVLGGLLSAYHLSGDPMFLKKAQDLGSILVVGFKSPSGIPYSDINLRAKSAHGPAWNPDSTTSEVTTIQLEFRDLSRITNIPIFEESAFNVSKHVHKLRKLQGLVPIHITPSTGNFRSTSVITLGARGDSYYEYLLKQWIQTGKTIDFLRDDYLEAVEGMKNLLLQRTKVSNLTFIGELENNGKIFKPKMDHLVCYLPGTLALGVAHGLPSWHMDFAKALLYTCYQTYKRQPTGLAPEITFFQPDDDAQADFFVKNNDAHNLLRPETVESLWYLYQITGDVKYQEWGWEIFQSFLKHTRVQHGFTSISSVLHPDNTRPRDLLKIGWTIKEFDFKIYTSSFQEAAWVKFGLRDLFDAMAVLMPSECLELLRPWSSKLIEHLKSIPQVSHLMEGAVQRLIEPPIPVLLRRKVLMKMAKECVKSARMEMDKAVYHAEFEKTKGKFTAVSDDPELMRIKANTKIISNVAYHGDLEKTALMEQQRNLGGDGDTRNKNGVARPKTLSSYMDELSSLPTSSSPSSATSQHHNYNSSSSHQQHTSSISYNRGNSHDQESYSSNSPPTPIIRVGRGKIQTTTATSCREMAFK